MITLLLTVQIYVFGLQYGHNISSFSPSDPSVVVNCNCQQPNPSPGPTPKPSDEPTFVGGDTGTTYK